MEKSAANVPNPLPTKKFLAPENKTFLVISQDGLALSETSAGKTDCRDRGLPNIIKTQEAINKANKTESQPSRASCKKLTPNSKSKTRPTNITHQRNPNPIISSGTAANIIIKK